jgi:hypothetical protein
MSPLDTLTVVAAVTGSCAAGLVGRWRGARGARRSQPDVHTSKRWQAEVTVLVVLGGIAAALR